MKFNYSIFLSLESRDGWTPLLKKFFWSLLYSVGPREKIFFLTKFFNQSEFEKKSNWIIALFCHWNRERGEQWWWENCTEFFLLLFMEEKWIIFAVKFFDQLKSEKNCKFISPVISYGVERGVKIDEEKIGLCLFFDARNPVRNGWKIFRPIKICEYITVNYFAFLSWPSREMWTLMMKKFNWVSSMFVLEEKVNYFDTNFSTNQNSRKN